jgi:hypothetical protein
VRVQPRHRAELRNVIASFAAGTAKHYRHYRIVTVRTRWYQRHERRPAPRGIPLLSEAAKVIAGKIPTLSHRDFDSQRRCCAPARGRNSHSVECSPAHRAVGPRKIVATVFMRPKLRRRAPTLNTPRHHVAARVVRVVVSFTALVLSTDRDVTRRISS